MATKVFISWSGDLSNRLADAVRQWLPGVLQFVKPYFTPTDIEKGANWASGISSELSDSDIGIICLTKDNLEKPWILFESGALSKKFDKSKVCTLLFNVETTDLKGPLTLFQNTSFTKADFKKLVKTVNDSGGDAKLDDGVLNEVFDMWWPKLEKEVKKILADHQDIDGSTQRSDRDILEEILELARMSTRRQGTSRPINLDVMGSLLVNFFRAFDASQVEGEGERTYYHLTQCANILEAICNHLQMAGIYDAAKKVHPPRTTSLWNPPPDDIIYREAPPHPEAQTERKD